MLHVKLTALQLTDIDGFQKALVEQKVGDDVNGTHKSNQWMGWDK